MNDERQSVSPERWNRIVTLFHAARELDAGDRSAYLDGACAGDENLRRSVERLLAADVHPDAVVDRPILPWPAAPVKREWAGSTLAHYRILEKLGQGGMGTVYKAADTRLEREVAIKFLSDSLGNAESEQRFIQEARAASALDHPNICTIFNIDRTPGGNLYIVMAYYPGETVRRLIGKAALPVDEAVDIAMQASRGLSQAHAKGIVHRDIKPANLVRTPSGIVKILDFGIAKLEHGPELTGQGMGPGTPHYMSPEQVQGQRVDRQTDIWALGAVLYEMLSGRPPFDAGESVGLWYAVVHNELPPLERSDVPPDLEQLVRSMLAKEPAQRPGTMDQVTRALERIQSPGAAHSAGRGKQIPSLVVLPFANVSGDPANDYFGDGLTEELINALTSLDGLRVVCRTTAFHYQGRASDIREIGRELGVNAALEGSVRTAGRRVRITTQLINVADGYPLWSERYDGELDDVFALQDQIAQAIVSALRAELERRTAGPLVKPETDSPTAHQLYLKGRYHYNRVSSNGLVRGVEFFQQALDRDSRYARAHAGLATAYLYQGFWGFLAPAQVWPKVKTSAQRALELDASLAEAHAALGSVFAVQDWNWPAARRELEVAIELNPKEPSVRGQYTTFYLMPHGMAAEALEQYQQCLELDPLSAQNYAGAALALLMLKRYEDAIRYATEGIEMSAKLLTNYWALGMTYLTLGDHQRARTPFEKALDIYRDSTFTQAALGVVEATSGRHREARQALDELERLSSERYVAPSHVAWLWIALQDHDRAFEWLNRAAEERDTLPLYLTTLPLYEPIRSDSRYLDLLGRLRLGERLTGTVTSPTPTPPTG